MVLCTCCWRNQSISTFCLCVSESRDCMISWGRGAQQENEDEEEEARLLTESRNGLWFSRFWNSWMRKPSSIQWREPIKQSWGPKSMLPKHVFSAPQVIYMYMGKENPRKKWTNLRTKRNPFTQISLSWRINAKNGAHTWKQAGVGKKLGKFIFLLHHNKAHDTPLSWTFS